MKSTLLPVLLLIVFIPAFLPAQNPSIVKDIIPGATSSYPRGFTKIAKGKFLFFATNEDNQFGLWFTNGNNIINEITTLTGGVDLIKLANSKVVFRGAQLATGFELWVTDGTSGGTFLLKDITEGPTHSSISFGPVINGKLFFIARPENDANSPLSSLWVTDGTVTGTMKLKEGINYFYPVTGEVLNNLFIFYSYTPFGDTFDLWRSDGTEAGTFILSDFSHYMSLNKGFLASYKNKIYFRGYDANHGDELWKTDGTVAGTKMVKDINPGPEGSYLDYLTVFKNKLYFTARTPANGLELWSSSGNSSGTSQFIEVNPGSSNGVYTISGIAGGKLFFVGNDVSHGSEMWRTDGTLAGTFMLKNVDLGNFANSDSWLFVPAHDSAYYVQQIGAYYPTYKLCKTDGTVAGTTIVNHHVADEAYAIYPEALQLTYAAGHLFYINYFDYVGDAFNGVWQLVKTNGSQSVTYTFDPFFDGGMRDILLADKDTLYLSINMLNTGIELYKLNINAPVKTMEVCNGIDDDMDGIVDNLAYLTPTGTISSCFGQVSTLMQSNTWYDYFSYQWLKNGSPVPGETDSWFSTFSPDDGDYEVIVASGGCIDTMGVVTVISNYVPPVSITPLGSTEICLTGSVDLKATDGAGYNWQWIKWNNQYILGATNNIYTATDAADYRVKVTVGIGCTGISDITKVTISCREDGSEALQMNEELTLYPNPASGNLHVSWSTIESDAEPVISIMDFQGRMLFQQTIEEGNNSIELALSPDIVNGMYILLLKEGNEVRKKIFEVMR